MLATNTGWIVPRFLVHKKWSVMQKKKHTGLLIGVVAALVLVVAGGIWAKGYYQDHYVGTDYYTMVPMDYDLTPQMLHKQDGSNVGLGKDFELTAYNEQGEAKNVVFTVRGDDPAGYPQPGTYIYVKSSKYLVNGWDVIDVSQVPASVLSQINAR